MGEIWNGIRKELVELLKEWQDDTVKRVEANPTTTRLLVEPSYVVGQILADPRIAVVDRDGERGKAMIGVIHASTSDYVVGGLWLVVWIFFIFLGLLLWPIIRNRK